MKKIIAYIAITALCAVLLGGCGKTSSLSVEEEVEKALADERNIEDIPASDPDSVEIPGDEDKGVTADSISGSGSKNGLGTSAGTGTASSDDTNTKPGSSTSDSGKTSSPKGSSTETPARNINPFLGDTSKATSFNIGFNIETDSGLAGITWGSTKGTDGEYYLFAFDCTREFPRLYTARRNGEDVYDEVYTNLDFMFPEMIMFSSVEHVVEIRVSGSTATTYLDKYKVCDTDLNEAKPVGQIGVWVMEGDYHEYIDNLFVAEGYDGTGEWIYSDDFSRRDNLFAPELVSQQGRLYVPAGYHTAPSKKGK